ncbi:hypothetical protein HK101_008463 [Irineochytrium annulatum]|nr:hypothetical protein HK101_008463 [Irineochytrium annulatum]
MLSAEYEDPSDMPVGSLPPSPSPLDGTSLPTPKKRRSAGNIAMPPSVDGDVVNGEDAEDLASTKRPCLDIADVTSNMKNSVLPEDDDEVTIVPYRTTRPAKPTSYTPGTPISLPRPTTTTTALAPSTNAAPPSFAPLDEADEDDEASLDSSFNSSDDDESVAGSSASTASSSASSTLIDVPARMPLLLPHGAPRLPTSGPQLQASHQPQHPAASLPHASQSQQQSSCSTTACSSLSSSLSFEHKFTLRSCPGTPPNTPGRRGEAICGGELERRLNALVEGSLGGTSEVETPADDVCGLLGAAEVPNAMRPREDVIGGAVINIVEVVTAVLISDEMLSLVSGAAVTLGKISITVGDPETKIRVGVGAATAVGMLDVSDVMDGVKFNVDDNDDAAAVQSLTVDADGSLTDVPGSLLITVATVKRSGECC